MEGSVEGASYSSTPHSSCSGSYSSSYTSSTQSMTRSARDLHRAERVADRPAPHIRISEAPPPPHARTSLVATGFMPRAPATPRGVVTR